MPRVMTIALLAAALAAVPAVTGADNDKAKGKAKGHEKHAAKEEGNDDQDHDRDTVLVFRDHDREVVHTYWREAYGPGNCPPGLAKKNNGCLPPGLAKKRYVVGQRLPPTIVVQPVPRPLIERLGPAPSGYEYAVVDGDVVKLAVGTRMVVDAISALLH